MIEEIRTLFRYIRPKQPPYKPTLYIHAVTIVSTNLTYSRDIPELLSITQLSDTSFKFLWDDQVTIVNNIAEHIIDFRSISAEPVHSPKPAEAITLH